MHTITGRSIKRRLVKQQNKKKVERDLPHTFYTTPSGIERVRILHPTKGWRDRNVDTLMSSY